MHPDKQQYIREGILSEVDDMSFLDDKQKHDLRKTLLKTRIRLLKADLAIAIKTNPDTMTHIQELISEWLQDTESYLKMLTDLDNSVQDA